MSNFFAGSIYVMEQEVFHTINNVKDYFGSQMCFAVSSRATKQKIFPFSSNLHKYHAWILLTIVS